MAQGDTNDTAQDGQCETASELVRSRKGKGQPRPGSTYRGARRNLRRREARRDNARNSISGNRAEQIGLREDGTTAERVGLSAVAGALFGGENATEA